MNAVETDGRISDVAVINLVHRRIIEITFAAYAAGLIYLSFVPFDLTLAPRSELTRGVVLGLAAFPFNSPDILANIAYYVPFGALGCAVLRRWGLGRILAAAGVLAGTAALSYLIESGQRFVASRVPSWVDFTCNMLGCALGVAGFLIWEGPIARVRRRALTGLQRNWWSGFSTAFVCAVLFVQLRPYDVVADILHTGASLRHADFSPTARWEGLRAEVGRDVNRGRRAGMIELDRVQWEYLLDRMADVLTYASVAAVLFIASTRRRKRAVPAPAPDPRGASGLSWLLCGAATIGLAATVTGIRVLLVSHGLDTAHLLCGFVGCVVGIPAGVALRRSMARASGHDAPTRSSGPTEPDRPRPRPLLPRAWETVTIAGVLVMIGAYELAPFDFRTSDAWRSSLLDRTVLRPFDAQFQSRINDAVYDISGDLLRFGLIGACLAMILTRRDRRSGRSVLAMSIAGSVAAAVGFESIHVFMVSRYADITTVILAAIGGTAGAVGVCWLRDFRASLAVAHADDALTRQLTEGASYDKTALSRLRSRRSDASQTDRVQSRPSD